MLEITQNALLTMETQVSDFKKGLKKMQNNLRGLTLQLISSASGNVRPYESLSEFGNAILNEEKNGSSFSISQAWTSEGIIKVTSLNELAKLFLTNTITGIQFKSFFEPSGSARDNYGRLD